MFSDRLDTEKIYSDNLDSDTFDTSTLGHQLFQSWSNFLKLTNSGHPLGQYHVVDIDRFVRKASNRYWEPNL